MMYFMLLLFGMAFLQEEGEVLERGAIHEAYAQPVLVRPSPGPILDRKPPEPLQEVPPEEKPDGENIRWIGGYWRMDEDRKDFVWVSGFWRQIPPGMEWIPGKFIKTEEGWRWYPGFWKSLEDKLEEAVEDPPPPIPEVGPSIPAPQPNMVWSQGYWLRQNGAYAWRSGFWMTHRPGWVWTPTCWVYTPGGYIRTPGFWDYALEYRGFLFSTVYYPRPVYLRQGFSHRPLWVIQSNDLPGGLFVRSGYGNYFYGDYFRPAFANQGFQFWSNGGRSHAPDPIFDYYRAERKDPWAQSVRQYGRDRVSGKPAPLPPPFVAPPTLPKTPGVVAPVPGLVPGGKWVGQLPKKPPSLVSTYKAPPKPDALKGADLKPKDGSPLKGKEASPPKSKDLPKGKDMPKGKEVDAPKSKDVPKGKGASPPKPKDMPKGKEVDAPKSKDVPKGKEASPPKSKEVDAPKPKEVSPPKPKPVTPEGKKSDSKKSP